MKMWSGLCACSFFLYLFVRKCYTIANNKIFAARYSSDAAGRKWNIAAVQPASDAKGNDECRFA